MAAHRVFLRVYYQNGKSRIFFFHSCLSRWPPRVKARTPSRPHTRVLGIHSGFVDSLVYYSL